VKRDRLAAVQRIREIQEQQARGALAMDRLRHREAVDAEAATWFALDARQQRLIGTDSSEEHRRTRAIAECGVLAARLQQEAALEAARQVMRSTDEWTVAARRVEALERLGSRLNEMEHEEAVRRSANEVDDLVLARFAQMMRSES